MGLKKGLGDVEHLMQAIEQGLPKQAPPAVLEYFAGPDLFSKNELLGKVVSLATFKRRKLLKLAQKAVALIVPSVLFPVERNVVLNPSHPQIARLTVGEPLEIRWDERLFATRARRSQ